MDRKSKWSFIAIILVLVNIIGFSSISFRLITLNENYDNCVTSQGKRMYLLIWKATVDDSVTFSLSPAHSTHPFYPWTHRYKDSGFFEGYAQIEETEGAPEKIVTDLWVDGHYMWEENQNWVWNDYDYHHYKKYTNDIIDDTNIKVAIERFFNYEILPDDSVHISLPFREINHGYLEEEFYPKSWLISEYETYNGMEDELITSYSEEEATFAFGPSFHSEPDEITSPIEKKSYAIGKDCPFSEKVAGWDYTWPEREMFYAHWEIKVEVIKDECQELIFPVDGKVTSPMLDQRKNPKDGIVRAHNGIDVWRKGIDGTNIVAPADGYVVRSGSDDISGNWIELLHFDIKKLKEYGDTCYWDVRTVYCHLKEPVPKEWKKQLKSVSQGDVIGRVGNTGRSKGSHLHFGIRVDGRWVDPLEFLPYPLTREAARARGLCPIDLIITDPNGYVVNTEIIEIYGAGYREYDINGDGDNDQEIWIPDRKIGIYQISVIPKPEALPTDTYSLIVSAGDTNIVLAEDVQINDIPPTPYFIRSTEAGIEPYDKDGTDPSSGAISGFPMLIISGTILFSVAIILWKMKHIKKIAYN